MSIRYDKYTDGLVPAIVQDAVTRNVLMMGFMNEAALEKTRKEGKVTFFSRSKGRLWTKGEESGHFLLVEEVLIDCDEDTILIKARPQGPTCHTGADTCWNEVNQPAHFLEYLEQVIQSRKEGDDDNSYVKKLFRKGLNKIAQKVGEEAVEVVIEAKDQNDDLFLNESADLLFHYLVLLNAKGYALQDVVNILKQRHAQ